MPELSVSVDAVELLRTLTLMEDGMRNPSDLMKDVLLVMIRSTQLNFEDGGRPPWDELKPSTIARRGAKALRGSGKRLGSLAAFGSIQILRDTGLLMQSVGSGAAGAFTSGAGFGESDETNAVIGTSQPGWQNQFPDSRGTRVAREFLLFQDQDQDDISAMSMDWLLRVGPYAAEA